MESLYRKYRPQTFADVVGQQHVVGTLERAVLEGRTSHAYLFCGPRGTGKTTMARLLAKALMCEQGPGQLPCGTCAQCQLIASGEHPDVYELDAASRTGVDNVREEIINRVDYAPVQGRYKVYIIDEVHMLTTAAFNALLKTLEEPPAHVVFVLCTTDPQKIPATILSRVQRFDFRPIGNEDIRARLAHVCEQEGFTYEDEALDLVVKNARGGMRDALSTLEQLSVFGSGVIGADAARDLLGAVSGDALGHVVDAMARRDVPTLFAQVGALVDEGRDLLQFTRELAAHMRDVYVVSVAGANAAVLPAASDAAALGAEAASFGSSDRLARILLVLGETSREMSTAPNQRLVLEIAFTRIARPEADLSLESLAERLADVERKLAALSTQTTAQPGSGMMTSPSPQPDASSRPVSHAPQSEVAAPRVVPTQPTNPVPAQQSAPASVTASEQYVSPTLQPAPQPAQRPASQPAAAPQPMPQPTQQSAPQSAPRAMAGPSSQRVAQQTPQPAPQGAYGPAPEPQRAASPVPQPPASTRASGLEGGALQRSWKQVVTELLSRMPSRGSLLSSAMATSDDGAELVVGLPKGSSFALKMLDRPDVRTVVEGVVNEVFGPRKLTFKEGIGSDLAIPPHAAASRQSTTVSLQSTAAQRPAEAPNAQPARAAWATQETRPAARGAQYAAPAQPYQTAQSSQPYQSAQSAAPAYPMPWDEPAAPAPASQAAPMPVSQLDPQASPQLDPQPQSPRSAEPSYDAVPYEELGAMDYLPDDQGYDPAYADVPSQPAWSVPSSQPEAQPVSPTPQSAPTAPQSPAQAVAPTSQPTTRPIPAADSPASSPQASSQGARPSQHTQESTYAATPTPQQAVPASSPTSTASQAASTQTPAPKPASATGDSTFVPATGDPTTVVPAPVSSTAPSQSDAPEQEPSQSIPDDLPPELTAILENAFEVFGPDVRVGR